MIHELWKELMKQAQRTSVKGKSENNIAVQNTLRTVRRNQITQKKEDIKINLDSTTQDLSKLIKGKFGKKVTTVLKEQKTTVEKLDKGI